MTTDCLPCELHRIGRKTLKEIVHPMIIDLDHELALIEMLPTGEFNDKIDKLCEDFYAELDKIGICSQSIDDRSDAADFARHITDGMMEFYVDRATIYYKDIVIK